MELLDLFCQVMGCSDRFRDDAARQLGEQFTREVGTGLDGFVLVPPPDGSSAVVHDPPGTASVSTDLVAPDGFGYPVVVWWEPAGAAADDSSGGDAPDSAPLQVRWAQLPAEELRSRYVGPFSAPWPVSPSFPFSADDLAFDVAWRPFPWPDVRLAVRTDRPASPALAQALVVALEAARERWNAAAGSGSRKGLIHDLGQHPRVVSPDELVVDVDFGSAEPAALLALLQALDEVAAAHGLVRVTVEGPRGS